MAKRQKNPFGVREDTVVTYQIWICKDNIQYGLEESYFDKMQANKRAKELCGRAKNHGEIWSYRIDEFEILKG